MVLDEGERAAALRILNVSRPVGKKKKSKFEQQNETSITIVAQENNNSNIQVVD